MKKIKESLQQLFMLTEAEVTIFLSAFTKRTLHKNEIFIETDKICNKIGLIEKGLFVCVYNKDGKEVVDEFAFEQHFITNYYSFLTHTPSEKEIRCIEDSIIYTINRDHLKKLAAVHPFIERMNNMINEKLFLRAHNRIKSILLDSASERYFQLINQRPDLVQRIPQYMLAAYLNISPETVSRIRKGQFIS